jgi:Domain of unknown function (DUF5103)
MRRLLFVIFLHLSGFVANAQVVPIPKSFHPNLMGCIAYPEGNPLGQPFYEMGTTNRVIFEFDELLEDASEYHFAAFLCTHDWQLSTMSTSEYLQGFPSQEITNVQHSFNTLIEYNHYRFEFPNDMMKIRLSGNYFVVVYTGDDATNESNWKIAYRLVAFENLVGIGGKVQASSVIPDRFKNQEIDFIIQHTDYAIYDYQKDLHCAIYQNMNWSTCITNLKPVFIKGTELIYDFNLGENDFPGGAEFRNFEFKSMQYQSSSVDHLERREDGYHLFLRRDQATGNRAQSSGIDINGNFFIRTDDGDDFGVESEYVWIHFSLAMPPLMDSEVMLDGRYFSMLSTPISLLYNESSKCYEGVAMLKQGLYDYRYITQDSYSSIQSTQLTEGNNAGTENTYYIIVYNNDRQTGHDRVIALKAMNSVK